MLLLLIDDREVAAGCRSSKNSEPIGCICPPALAQDWCVEEVFDLLRRDSVASKMLKVVVVPLELDIVHFGQCRQQDATRQPGEVPHVPGYPVRG